MCVCDVVVAAVVADVGAVVTVFLCGDGCCWCCFLFVCCLHAVASIVVDMIVAGSAGDVGAGSV